MFGRREVGYQDGMPFSPNHVRTYVHTMFTRLRRSESTMYTLCQSAIIRALQTLAKCETKNYRHFGSD